MARQEQEAKTRRREEARRRTRDLLLERAKQRLHAAAAAAATAVSAATTTATAAGAGIPRSIGGILSEGTEGSNDGVPAVGSVGGVRKAEGATSLWDVGGRAAGVPLYAQETWAARHSKVELYVCVWKGDGGSIIEVHSDSFHDIQDVLLS